jgi:hypothetical protein
MNDMNFVSLAWVNLIARVRHRRGYLPIDVQLNKPTRTTADGASPKNTLNLKPIYLLKNSHLCTFC